MTQITKEEKHTSKWLKKFNKKAWSKLSDRSKLKLCKRFNLKYHTSMDIQQIIKQLDIPMPPRSFTIAVLNEAKVKPNKLVKKNPYKELWMDKISFDTDQWGIIRSNIPYYGLLKDSSVSKEKQRQFEKLLASSSSLDKDDKLKVLSAIPTLSTFQINELIKVWLDEATKFSDLFIQHKNDVLLLIKKAEKEWREIEPSLDFYIGLEGGKQLQLDRFNHPTPQAIKLIIEKSIKGQSLAVQKVATQLYYQHKIKHFYGKKEIGFSLAPLLVSGSTGSGKSFLLQTGCDVIGLPYLHVDCSSMVSSGIKGYSVGDIMKDLLRKTNYNVKNSETAIIFLDEVDKLLSHHDGHSILFQLLRLVEGSDIPIDKSSHTEEREFSSINSISTHKMLFVFAGSFQTLIESKRSQSGFIKENLNDQQQPLTINDIEKTGLPQELLGRINDIVILDQLKREDYRSILIDSQHSPIKTYQQMLEISDVKFELNDKQLEEILDQVEKSKYGARSLHQIVKKYFDQVLFDSPSTQT